jgi:hypothetical protein
MGFGRPDAACAGLGPRAHASTWLARAVMGGTLAAVGSLFGSALLFTGVLSGITFRTHQVDGDLGRRAPRPGSPRGRQTVARPHREIDHL